MRLPIILASTSRFRQELLSRIQQPFEAVAPICDETPNPQENAEQTALRLAENKARSLSQQFPNALIIGSDQVLWCNEKQYGKPMSLDKAHIMLRELSGKTLTFYTALVLLNTAENRIHRHVDKTLVHMRSLSDDMITYYLQEEPDAIYCAGSAKSEGLGMILIERISSDDPNALIGLPMLRLIDFFMAEGVL